MFTSKVRKDGRKGYTEAERENRSVANPALNLTSSLCKTIIKKLKKVLTIILKKSSLF